MKTTASQPTASPERLQGFTLPNTYNCIQSALYQLSIGNEAQAIAFLKSAQASLIKAGLKWEL
jgi:hypothetical protein